MYTPHRIGGVFFRPRQTRNEDHHSSGARMHGYCALSRFGYGTTSIEPFWHVELSMTVLCDFDEPEYKVGMEKKCCHRLYVCIAIH
jgi:hypothetical protein